MALQVSCTFQALWIFCLIDYESPTYNNGEYRYPVWAIVIGWLISSMSIACIPLFAIYVFFNAEGDTWRDVSIFNKKNRGNFES